MPFNAQIKRMATGKISDKLSEAEFDNIIRQIEFIFNDQTVSVEKTFYAAATSGGSATKKVTIKFNQFGKLIEWKEE